MTHLEVLRLFPGHKRTRENQYTVKCPAHDDNNASLRINTGERGKTLIHCHAGCSTEAVCAAVGIEMKDLFDGEAPKQSTPAPAPKKTATPQKETAYNYSDFTGRVQLRKVRRYDADGKKHFTWQHQGENGWESGRAKMTPGLYNQEGILGTESIFIVEGEKDVETLKAHGIVAVSGADGAGPGKWRPEHTPMLHSKHVAIIPDNDDVGRAFAQETAAALHGVAASVRVLDLTKMWPDLPEHGDVTDLYEAMGDETEEILRAHAISTPEWDPSQEVGTQEQAEEKEPRKTQAETLLELVHATGAVFFHSETNEPYAALLVGTHTETLAVEGRDFSVWLNGLYYKETGKAVGAEAIKQVIAVLSAAARFDSPEPIPLYTRVTERDDAFWYDLTNPAWQAVKVTADGWTVSDAPPIQFIRYRHQAAQSIPQPGGDIRKILNYVNIKGVDTLFLCWLVACFVPGIPHPMPILYGEKGAAKSTASELLKRLIDPSALGTMTLQNDPRTLAVNLQQHWFLPFDNVSHINEETSDTLCRAISGSGIQQRKLYTNDEDTIFTFIRCLAINGINNVATRPDLLDRSLLIELERIAEAERKELAEVWEAFEADRPAILGGILDTLAQAMKIFPTVKLAKLPRMADFARWGYAIGEALGGKGQEFLDQYEANRREQNTEAINSDPVALLVVAFMKNHEEWIGRISELLSKLRDLSYMEGISTSSKAFPSHPNGLSRRLRGMKSNLEGIGIQCDIERRMNGAYVTLRRAKSSSLSSSSSEPNKINGSGHDDSMTISDGMTMNDGKHDDKTLASSSEKALQLNVYDGNDDNDDKFSAFEGRTPWDE